MGVTRNRQNFNWPSGSQTFWRYVIRSQKILCNYVNINWENNGKSNVRKHSPPSETDGCRLFPYICKPHRVFTPPSDKKVHLPWWLQRCPGPTIFPLVIVRLQACSRIIQVEIIQTPFFHWWTPNTENPWASRGSDRMGVNRNRKNLIGRQDGRKQESQKLNCPSGSVQAGND